MSRSSPPRTWHPGPGYEQKSPHEWYKRSEPQYRGRSPPRPYSPPRPISPRERPSKRPLSPVERKRSQSPRNERPQSPRNDQQHPRRSPVRPPSPTPHDRMPSPRRDRPPSPGRDRPHSPRRDRPPSPGRDRPHSPRRDRYSPRRDKPPSPGRDRPRSPYEWRSRSPHRHYDWGRRSRSPLHYWSRHSPPRHGPPPPRSPPRHWPPPPPEWDRYRGRYPERRSPPRWPPAPPPPPHHWDRRYPPPPPMPGPPPHDYYASRRPDYKPRPASPPRKEVRHDNKGEDSLIPTDEKEEEIESFDLPPYDPDTSIGQKYVIPVSGFFCKVCHKFYNSESSAKLTHCKTKTHYDKFAKWLSEKKVAALVQKRAVKNEIRSEEPPAKQAKMETQKGTTEGNSEVKYDPSQPTADTSVNDNSAEKQTDLDTSEMSVDQNGSSVEESELEQNALITNETKKEDEVYVEATLFNLRKLKVNQLKANLEKRGMKSTGLKPLLLKRLEKVLADEAAAAAAESNQGTEEETNNEADQNAEEKIGDESSWKMHVLKILESDVEAANEKTQWITERELERELLQVENVKKVESITSRKDRIFNGRRTNVEWTIKLAYDGDVPEGGLKFSLLSHQQLPFHAMVVDEAEE